MHDNDSKTSTLQSLKCSINELLIAMIIYTTIITKDKGNNNNNCFILR